MTLLNRLEKHLGWIAIGNLPLYIVSAQGLLYIWSMLNPGAVSLLMFDPIAIIYGHEYWRLLTFLFVTPIQNPIFAFFFLYLLYVYGTALEDEWGSFPFTLFYLVGVLGAIIAGFFFGSRDGAFYLNTTIFLAFAALHPDFQLYLFFIVPLKIKWLAWLTWITFAYQIFMAPIFTKAAILISVANYLLFFGKMHTEQVVTRIQQVRHRQRYKDWNN